jgi:hypothetical protein
VNGVCEFCFNSSSVSTNQQDGPAVTDETIRRFDETIKLYSDGEKKYHALLLLSGGKDSAYILNRMKTEYPRLNILCLYVNDGFASSYALKNASNTAEKLKTDLIIANSSVDQFARALRQSFLELNGRGSSGVVDFVDGSLIFEVGQATAMEFDIPLVIGGLSWVQVQQIVGQDDFSLIKEDRPRIIFPLAVWRTNEQEIRLIVRSQGLLLPGSDNPLVSNNALIITMSAIDVLNNGYCSFEPEFAQLVREGKTDRKTWLYNFELLEFATKRGLLDKEIKQTLSKLNLSLEDVVRNKK